MQRGRSDNERILGFVEDCRDAHVAPYPVGTRVIQEHTGLSMYCVRTGVDQLLSEGRLTKMPAYPDHGVVLP
jgi:phage head maturation protease